MPAARLPLRCGPVPGVVATYAVAATMQMPPANTVPAPPPSAQSAAAIRRDESARGQRQRNSHGPALPHRIGLGRVLENVAHRRHRGTRQCLGGDGFRRQCRLIQRHRLIAASGGEGQADHDGCEVSDPQTRILPPGRRHMFLHVRQMDCSDAGPPADTVVDSRLEDCQCLDCAVLLGSWVL